MRVNDDYELSTDQSRLDLDQVEKFLRQSYWAPDRPRETIAKSLENSLCLGAYRKSDGLQVGLCRVVTDHATFGWVCDVFVAPDFRGEGLGKAMIESLVGLPELAGVRLVLVTRNAHGLYEQFGFEALPSPEGWMIRRSHRPVR